MTDPTEEAPDASPADDYAAKLARAARTVADWLRHLIDPDQVVELRALRVQDGTRGRDGVSGSTWAGTFLGTDAELLELATAGLKLSGNCQGVYYTINPLQPDRHRRKAPRVQRAERGELATDEHVLARRWLLIDVDPIRAMGHEKDSSTDGEKEAARETMQRVKEYLTGGADGACEGWPAPIVSDSGNGFHLLYRLAEAREVGTLPTPADDAMRLCLVHLADKFNGAGAEIDTTVFNPGRIVKLPGTLACKGEATAERPHRRAKVLEVPRDEPRVSPGDPSSPQAA